MQRRSLNTAPVVYGTAGRYCLEIKLPRILHPVSRAAPPALHSALVPISFFILDTFPESQVCTRTVLITL